MVAVVVVVDCVYWMWRSTAGYCCCNFEDEIWLPPLPLSRIGIQCQQQLL